MRNEKHKITRHGSHARRELQLSPGRFEINNKDGGIEPKIAAGGGIEKACVGHH